VTAAVAPGGRGEFADVTETPGLPVSRTQLARTHHRYEVARDQARGGDVLEVACGAGLGLEMLARDARRVVAGDVSASNLAWARRTHDARFPLVRFAAESLPFRNGAFDLVVMLEAIYYVRDTDRMLDEFARVLRPGGRVVLSSVNPRWPGFGASAWSTRYFGSDELAAALRYHDFDVRLFGAFPEPKGAAATLRTLMRAVAMRLGLGSRSLRAKAILKRAFYGPLLRQPAILDGGVSSGARSEPLDPDAVDRRHSILYAIATRA
jgi:ubiquinone/menaquinone biosynthesis C-methylase UbiE